MMTDTGPQENPQNHDKVEGGLVPDKPSQAEGEDDESSEPGAARDKDGDG
jgi:hypothetical protein